MIVSPFCVEKQIGGFESAQVVRSARRLRTALPRALIRASGMQPGPVIVEIEAGGDWQSCLYGHSSSHAHYCISKGRSAAAAGLQLEAGQTICLAALSPSRLLVSRQGEPHFSAAASQGPPDPWPLTVRLNQSSIRAGRLSAAAGRSICRDSVQSVPAVICCSPGTEPQGLRCAGEAVSDLPLP